jgi:hypothetical protein
MKFAMRLILSLLLFSSFSSYLLADKDWGGCGDDKDKRVDTPKMLITVTKL